MVKTNIDLNPIYEEKLIQNERHGEEGRTAYGKYPNGDTKCGREG
jgi:hypothetical protein